MWGFFWGPVLVNSVDIQWQKAIKEKTDQFGLKNQSIMGLVHLGEEKGHKPGCKKLDFCRCVINNNVITLFTILKIL